MQIYVGGVQNQHHEMRLNQPTNKSAQDLSVYDIQWN